MPPKNGWNVSEVLQQVHDRALDIINATGPEAKDEASKAFDEAVMNLTNKAAADAESMKLLREVIQGSQRLSKKAASEAATAYKHLWPAVAAFPYEVITTDAILALANGLRDGDHRPDIPPVPESLYRAFIFRFALTYTDKPFEGDQQGPQIAGAIVEAYQVAKAVSGQPVKPVEHNLGLKKFLKTDIDTRQKQAQILQEMMDNERRGLAQTVQQATRNVSDGRDVDAQRLVESAYAAGQQVSDAALNILEQNLDESEVMLAELRRHSRSEVMKTEMLVDRAFIKQEDSGSKDFDEAEHVEDSEEGEEDGDGEDSEGDGSEEDLYSE